MNAVAKVETPKRSLIADMAAEYGMDPEAFQKTLKATVVPANTTNEDFAAFLLVAKHYKLNPILKEIFAFPKRGGGIQPIVSVDGWANLINSHPACDGFEFTDALDDKGALQSITCKMYRKDRAHPVSATEYMAECERGTETWKQWPRRMLRHKALIQAARYAFGFAGIMEPDEAERMGAENGHYANTPGARLTPPPAPSPPPALEVKTGTVPESPPAKPADPVTIIRHDEPARDISAADKSMGAEEAYLDWLGDAKFELAQCMNADAVEELRERILAEIRPGDVEMWKEACADRATAVFKGKPR